jgi:hypothetical protein
MAQRRINIKAGEDSVSVSPKSLTNVVATSDISSGELEFETSLFATNYAVHFIGARFLIPSTFDGSVDFLIKIDGKELSIDSRTLKGDTSIDYFYQLEVPLKMINNSQVILRSTNMTKAGATVNVFVSMSELE